MHSTFNCILYSQFVNILTRGDYMEIIKSITKAVLALGSVLGIFAFIIVVMIIPMLIK